MMETRAEAVRIHPDGGATDQARAQLEDCLQRFYLCSYVKKKSGPMNVMVLYTVLYVAYIFVYYVNLYTMWTVYDYPILSNRHGNSGVLSTLALVLLGVLIVGWVIAAVLNAANSYEIALYNKLLKEYRLSAIPGRKVTLAAERQRLGYEINRLREYIIVTTARDRVNIQSNE